MNPAVVVIGIPESGKSSFIAALSHALEFKEIDTVLTLAQLPDEAEYLFEMRRAWHGCQDFERTKSGLHPIVFNLIDKNNHRVDLAFPDIAGEEFEQQWSTRVWNASYLSAIEGALGILLFINAKTLRKPFSLADAARVRQAAMLNVLDEDESTSNEAKEGRDAVVNSGEAIAKLVASQGVDPKQGPINPAIWNPRLADEQAKLVDVLQSLVNYAPHRRWRLGIIVSAWDLVAKVDPKAKPRGWFDKNVPLIGQYLRSNHSSFFFQVFGVSAQGGDPVSDADRLQSFANQSERVKVLAGDYEGHDLTRIVAWVTSDNE